MRVPCSMIMFFGVLYDVHAVQCASIPLNYRSLIFGRSFTELVFKTVVWTFIPFTALASDRPDCVVLNFTQIRV